MVRRACCIGKALEETKKNLNHAPNKMTGEKIQIRRSGFRSTIFLLSHANRQNKMAPGKEINRQVSLTMFMTVEHDHCLHSKTSSITGRKSCFTRAGGQSVTITITARVSLVLPLVSLAYFVLVSGQLLQINAKTVS